MRYCITCGNKLLDGDIYCGHCGAAVPDWLREAPGDNGGLPNEAPKSAPHGVKQPSEPNQPRGKSDENKQEAEEKHKGPLKCPACGELLSPHENTCPSCGYKLKEASEGAIGRLYQTINSIEEKRPKKEKPHRQTSVQLTRRLQVQSNRFPSPLKKRILLNSFLLPIRTSIPTQMCMTSRKSANQSDLFLKRGSRSLTKHMRKPKEYSEIPGILSSSN